MYGLIDPFSNIVGCREEYFYQTGSNFKNPFSATLKIKPINILVDNLENFWNMVSYEKCRKGHSSIPHSFLDIDKMPYIYVGRNNKGLTTRGPKVQNMLSDIVSGLNVRIKSTVH